MLDYHPSFAWTIKAKIRSGIYQPIIDPLNKGLDDVEMMSYVKFDPYTF